MTVYGGAEMNHARLRDLAGVTTQKTLSFIQKSEGRSCSFLYTLILMLSSSRYGALSWCGRQLFRHVISGKVSLARSTMSDIDWLVVQCIRRCPMVFFHLPHDMINAILQFAIAGMCLQERLALKAALNFMVSWLPSVNTGWYIDASANRLISLVENTRRDHNWQILYNHWWWLGACKSWNSYLL